MNGGLDKQHINRNIQRELVRKMLIDTPWYNLCLSRAIIICILSYLIWQTPKVNDLYNNVYGNKDNAKWDEKVMKVTQKREK